MLSWGVGVFRNRSVSDRQTAANIVAFLAMKKSRKWQSICARIVPILMERSKKAHHLRNSALGAGEHRLQNRHVPVAERRPYRIANERGLNRMDIRFVSSLTSEDEELFAPALLKAVAALLDQLPITYTVRIETTGAEVFQHAHAAAHEPAKTDILESVGGNGHARGLNHYLGRLAQ